MQHNHDDVASFFRDHPTVGLVLPDGWFGRPYDNILVFSDLSIGDNELRISFSQGESLHVAGDIRVTRQDNSLVLEGFTAAEWTWPFYGSDERKHKQYATGTIELLGQPF